MGKGWISVHRQIWDNEYLWDNKPFARGQAWIDLLLLANHEEQTVLMNKKVVSVERGQTITSIRKLGERWGWGRHKVCDFLNALVIMQMAKIESDTKKTVVTIENYSFFQDFKKEKGHQRDTEGTAKDTNNNIITKQDNKKTKEIKGLGAGKLPHPPSLDEVREYCLERQNGIDPERFFDFYTANGWKQSRGKPIVDWKAAIRTWEGRNKASAQVEATPYKPKKYKTILKDGVEVDIEVKDDE